jgi:hypothetical protein
VRNEAVGLRPVCHRMVAGEVDERLPDEQERALHRQILGGEAAGAGDHRPRLVAAGYGVYRYFLIAGLLTLARVTMAEPVP